MTLAGVCNSIYASEHLKPLQVNVYIDFVSAQ